MVGKYNDMSTPMNRGGESSLDIDTGGLKALAVTVKQRAAYQDDPTCQTLLFWVAFLTNDYQSAQTASDTVQQLYKRGLYANSNIRANQPVSVYSDMVTSISPAANGANRRNFGG